MSIDLYRRANRAWLDLQFEVDSAQATLSALKVRRDEAYEQLRREAARLTTEERALLAKEMFGER